MEKRKWFITGGCGFIGTTLIAYLNEHCLAEAVRVFDNLSTGNREDLNKVAPDVRNVQGESAWRVSAAAGPLAVDLVPGDIRDADAVKQAMQGADVVVHLAANTGVQPSIADPMADMESNVMGTLNVLEAARLHGVERFLFASSGAPIGNAKPPLTEEAVCRPISPYGASKLAGEAYCSAYHSSFGINTIALRFSNVYGPLSGKKGSLVAKFINNAYEGKPWIVNGDGHQTRDFIYSQDLVRAMVATLDIKEGGEVFQIATGVETSVLDIARLLAEVMEEEMQFSPAVEFGPPLSGDVMRNYADISKARRMLGWQPEMDLKTGLRETVRWFARTRGMPG